MLNIEQLFLPTPSVRSNYSFLKEGGATAENSIKYADMEMLNDNYLPTLNMEILEGRKFR